MPHRTRAEQRIADIDISPTKLLADVERLTAERDEAQAHAEEYLTGLQRERAEFVNFKRRIEQASRCVAVEQLCLSPQCGFSSTVEGNALTLEQEQAKLRLIVKTAAEVWG